MLYIFSILSFAAGLKMVDYSVVVSCLLITISGVLAVLERMFSSADKINKIRLDTKNNKKEDLKHENK